MQPIHHHIQKDILRSLTRGPRRFSQLKPVGMESNIFMYHLKSLISAHLVNKADGQYELSPTGIMYVEKLSAKTFTPRLQPKIIAVLVIENSAGECLLLQRLVAPQIGQLMLPSGKLHYGESLPEHAARELQEKTNLNCPLNYRGIINVRFGHRESIDNHFLASVWYGQADDQSAMCHDDRFQLSWATISAADTLAGTEQMWRYARGEADFSDLLLDEFDEPDEPNAKP